MLRHATSRIPYWAKPIAYCRNVSRLQGSRGMTAAAKSKRNETVEERAARKELVKQQKAEKKARREGKGDEGYGQKPCTLCHQQKDLLIRCQIDKTEIWNMVCGKCWNEVSGGIVDGDKEHPYYRYGGLWKNLHKQDAVPPSQEDKAAEEAVTVPSQEEIATEEAVEAST